MAGEKDVVMKGKQGPIVWVERGFDTPTGAVVAWEFRENYVTADRAREIAGALLDAAVRAGGFPT